jgi:hypothetical protein
MKNTHFFGQPIFSQLLSLVDRSLVSKVTSKNQSDRYYKSFDTWQHLVTMLYCTFSGATSLRGVVYGSFGLAEPANPYRNTQSPQAIYHLGWEQTTPQRDIQGALPVAI